MCDHLKCFTSSDSRGQCCPVEISAMIEMFTLCAVQGSNQYPHVATEHLESGSETKELVLSLTNVNSHMWLLAALLHSTNLDNNSSGSRNQGARDALHPSETLLHPSLLKE